MNAATRGISNCKVKEAAYYRLETYLAMCREMVEILIGSGTKKKIQQVLLSNDTICRRIDDMAANVCQQVCSEIKQSTLQASIQLNKSTDSALKSHLIAFARCEKYRKIKEEFLFSNTLSATTTVADVKTLVDCFFFEAKSSASRILSTFV